ncbi:hypothetical protein M8818_004293 [Zalaria obscura]|uniref:Uncharacterized protein n=1 Tax=Zalaria obscura TaxID=2024903 RepID=A0ACC3SE70_9PEZI
MECVANLLVLEVDGQIMLSHHSVRQFVFPKSAMLPPIHSSQEQSERRIGSLCVFRLSIDLPSLALTRRGQSTRVRVPDSFLKSLVPKTVANLLPPNLLPTTSLPPLVLQRTPASSTAAAKKAEFLDYARANWMIHNRLQLPDTAEWYDWLDLVLDQRQGVKYPWPQLGEAHSLAPHICGLLGWAIMNNHTAALHLLNDCAPPVIRTEIKKHKLLQMPLANHGGVLPLELAIRTGFVLATSLLRENSDPWHIGLDGKSSLHVAAETGCLEHVRWMLAHQPSRRTLSSRVASVDTRDKTDKTALDYAAMSDHRHVVAELVNYCDILSTTSEGNTALHLAVMRGHTECVKELLNDKTKEMTNSGYSTPLDLAVVYGRLDVVKLLI